MNSLPTEIKTLRKLGVVLDKLMSDSGTTVEVRANEFYHHVIKHPELKSEFPTSTEFSRFLRVQHDQGIMKQFIDYRVDTFNKQKYQWFFRRTTSSLASKSSAETLKSNYNYYKQSKTVKCSNGEFVNSNQEKLIYETLLDCNEFTVRHDHPLTHEQETKYVDFFIMNKLLNTVFYWEHFGMTNDETYKDLIPDKLDWYRMNGYKTIEEGGSLITTYYSTDNELIKNIHSLINMMKKATNKC